MDCSRGKGGERAAAGAPAANVAEAGNSPRRMRPSSRRTYSGVVWVGCVCVCVGRGGVVCHSRVVATGSCVRTGKRHRVCGRRQTWQGLAGSGGMSQQGAKTPPCAGEGEIGENGGKIARLLCCKRESWACVAATVAIKGHAPRGWRSLRLPPGAGAAAAAVAAAAAARRRPAPGGRAVPPARSEQHHQGKE